MDLCFLNSHVFPGKVFNIALFQFELHSTSIEGVTMTKQALTCSGLQQLAVRTCFDCNQRVSKDSGRSIFVPLILMFSMVISLI